MASKRRAEIITAKNEARKKEHRIRENVCMHTERIPRLTRLQKQEQVRMQIEAASLRAKLIKLDRKANKMLAMQRR